MILVLQTIQIILFAVFCLIILAFFTYTHEPESRRIIDAIEAFRNAHPAITFSVFMFSLFWLVGSLGVVAHVEYENQRKELNVEKTELLFRLDFLEKETIKDYVMTREVTRKVIESADSKEEIKMAKCWVDILEKVSEEILQNGIRH